MLAWFKDFVHNSIVHPMMPFMPAKMATRLHDWNATWAYGLNRYDEMKMEGHSPRPVTPS